MFHWCCISCQQEVVAFISMMSGYHQPEVTVDLMRHQNDLSNGTMECLFASVFQALQQQGWERFNFSLSPLAGVGEAPDSRRAEKALHYLAQHLKQFYNFQGLHSFKEKFQPQWEPRYLAYPGWATLPDAVIGLVRASTAIAFWITSNLGLNTSSYRQGLRQFDSSFTSE